MASPDQLEIFTAVFNDQGLSAAIDAVAAHRPPPPPAPACSSFLRRVCVALEVEPKQMLYGGRTKRLADVRHIAMWVCREYLGASYPEIGKALGGMDHSSIIHGVRRVDKTPRLLEQGEKIISAIQGGPR